MVMPIGGECHHAATLPLHSCNYFLLVSIPSADGGNGISHKDLVTLRLNAPYWPAIVNALSGQCVSRWLSLKAQMASKYGPCSASEILIVCRAESIISHFKFLVAAACQWKQQS